MRSKAVQRDAPIVSPPHRITMQESRGVGALTGYPATSRRWWYLPSAVVAVGLLVLQNLAGVV